MNNLEKKRDELVKQLTGCANMLKGSLSSVCISCNRGNCICKTPSGAKAFRLTYKDADQKTKTIYVPKEKLKTAKNMVLNFQRCREIIDQLIAVNILIFKEKS